jgi:hypothetical protein
MVRLIRSVLWKSLEFMYKHDYACYVYIMIGFEFMLMIMLILFALRYGFEVILLIVSALL